MKSIVKYLLSFALTAVLLCTGILPAYATDHPEPTEDTNLYFDLSTAGWDDDDQVLFYIYPVVGEEMIPWGARKGLMGHNEGNGIWSYDVVENLAKRGYSLTDGQSYAIIFTDQDSRRQTYPLLFDTTCLGDTAYCDDPYDGVTYWRHQDPDVYGPLLMIQPTGHVTGRTLPHNVAYQMFNKFINNSLRQAVQLTGTDGAALLRETAEQLGLSGYEYRRSVEAYGGQEALPVYQPDIDPGYDAVFPQSFTSDLARLVEERYAQSGLVADIDVKVLCKISKEYYLFTYDLPGLAIADSSPMAVYYMGNYNYYLDDPCHHVCLYDGERYEDDIQTAYRDGRISNDMLARMALYLNNLQEGERIITPDPNRIYLKMAEEEYEEVQPGENIVIEILMETADLAYTVDGTLFYDPSVLTPSQELDNIFLHTGGEGDNAYFTGRALNEGGGQISYELDLLDGADYRNNADYYVPVWDQDGNLTGQRSGMKIIRLVFTVNDDVTPGVYQGVTAYLHSAYRISGEPIDLTDIRTDADMICLHLGDADQDGMVTIYDVTAIQRYLADLKNDMVEATEADADSDGVITIFDATRIQRYLAGMCDIKGNPDTLVSIA